MKGCLTLVFVVALLLALRATAQVRVSLTTLNALEERLKKGGDTTFVVNLWATWCAPCVVEMPHFERLQTEYTHKPLRILFVSLDGTTRRDAVVKLVGNKELKSEVWILNERDQQYFIPKISPDWSGAIPATLFVNTAKGIRIFKEQEFDYQQLENSYLSIVH